MNGDVHEMLDLQVQEVGAGGARSLLDFDRHALDGRPRTQLHPKTCQGVEVSGISRWLGDVATHAASGK
jgi:hypothetical protein